MNKQRVKYEIKKIEQYYHLLNGSLKKYENMVTAPRKKGSANIPSIRQAIAMYLHDTIGFPVREIVHILGFKEHSGLYKALKAGRRHLELNDRKFMSYYNTVMGLLNKTGPAKGSREFRKMAEEFIRNNPDKSKHQLATLLGVTSNHINVYARSVRLEDDGKKVSGIGERPPATYSNRNNIQQYFEQ